MELTPFISCTAQNGCLCASPGVALPPPPPPQRGLTDGKQGGKEARPAASCPCSTQRLKRGCQLGGRPGLEGRGSA